MDAAPGANLSGLPDHVSAARSVRARWAVGADATETATPCRWFARAIAGPALAGVPSDRADVLTIAAGAASRSRSFGAGAQEVRPVLVVANYYEDMVTSASIDVLSTASPATDAGRWFRVDWSARQTLERRLDSDNLTTSPRPPTSASARTYRVDRLPARAERRLPQPADLTMAPSSATRTTDDGHAGLGVFSHPVLARCCRHAGSYELINHRQIRYATPRHPGAFAPELYLRTSDESAAAHSLP
jgi:hypothetical protein